jgi:MSHA biogenesis protein MshL
MNIILAAAMFLFATQQRLPAELQVSQLEGARTQVSGIVIVPAQNPVITNTPQIPSTQLDPGARAQRFDMQISVEFVDADLRATLSALAQYYGLNLAMPPAIMGMVTIDLDNVTLLQALDAILSPRGLQYTIDGNLLRVDLIQMESRTFSFDYITTQRALARSVSANSSAGGVSLGTGGFTGTTGVGAAGIAGVGGGGGGSSTSISGTEQTNLFMDLQTSLDLLKSEMGTVIINPMAGLIFVTDFPRNLNMIQIFLETLESAVQRQVIIEAKIIEVKLNEDSQVGVNWTAIFGNVLRIDQTLGVTGTFSVNITHGDFNALISALNNVGTVNVLSSPTVATLNNQPAVIRVGTQDIFFTTTTQVDPRTGTIVQTAVTPSAINEGVVLDVTPQISDDGIITMNIHPTITERTGQATSPRGDSVPIVDVRETDTVVRIQEGQTVLIAGLISDRQLETVSKVPVLGDVPVIGGLFRRTQIENRKTDLVILLTPRVLNVRTAVDFTRSRIEAQEQMNSLKR